MSSLSGKRVVVTRAQHQNAQLKELLQHAQAIPVVFPCIAIVPPEDTGELDKALKKWDSYDWVVFTSQNTVVTIAERVDSLGLTLTSLPHIATVGETTANALRMLLNLQPNLIPDNKNAEGLVEAIHVNDETRVFLPQSEIARPMIAETFRASGAEVFALTAYRTITGWGGEAVPTMIDRGDIDALTFTSPSTVDGFVKRVRNHPKMFDIPAACIGPTTASAAEKAGFQHVIMPENPSQGELLVTLTDYFDSLDNQTQ